MTMKDKLFAKYIDELEVRSKWSPDIETGAFMISLAEYLKRWQKVDEDGWIPCSERLPVPNEFDETGKFFKAYLVQDKRNTMYTALWNGENWVLWTRNIRIENVVAWMPLPEPYKEGGAE